MRILSGDIGGTKTLLQIGEMDGDRCRIEREERFVSREFSSFDDLVERFIASDKSIDAACFAVAGPVLHGIASVTNLEWTIHEEDLSKRFGIRCVRIVNDFYAVARGVPLLDQDDVVVLNEGNVDRTRPIAILGAGTGLGEAILLPDIKGWRVVSSEGGHTDFAPTNQEQMELLTFLGTHHHHVSYERVVSGMGIRNIYEFLLSQRGEHLPTVDDIPAHVSKLAEEGDPTALHAFEIFVDAYAAEASNLGLKVLAQGGVYLAGGIAAKNLERFTDGRFMNSFLHKGRFAQLVETFPVAVITNAEIGLRGAAAIAQAFALECAS